MARQMRIPLVVRSNMPRRRAGFGAGSAPVRTSPAEARKPVTVPPNNIAGALVHTSADRRGSAFPGQTCAGRGEAGQNGDADLDLGDLTVEVPRGQALARQLDAVPPIAGKSIHWIVFWPAHISARLRW